MKIDDMKRVVDGILGEKCKKRTEAIISLDKGYVRWNTRYWTDDVWESYIDALEKNRDIEIEQNGDVLIVFKKSRKEKASE